MRWDSEGIIGNALFSDGSASLIVSQTPVEDTKVQCDWELIDTGSILLPESLDVMSWKVGDHGFEMLLTGAVGEHIEESLGGWLASWLRGHGLEVSDIHFWGIHPGGPRILDGVQTSLGLDDFDLEVSRAVLANFGNMSSPTVLFILEEFGVRYRAQRSGRRAICVLLAFGPGLVAEVALLAIKSAD